MISDFSSRILGAIAVLFLCAAASAAEIPMDCVEEITMPSVTSGMVTSLPDTILVHILIGKHGLAQKVEYDDLRPKPRIFPTQRSVLLLELDKYFKDGTRYVEACEGKTISFTVRYVIEGNPTDRLYSSEMRFRPPNEFIVRSHPVIPALDSLPAGRFTDPKDCIVGLHFVDAHRNPVSGVSITTRPYGPPTTNDERGYLEVFVEIGTNLQVAGVTPNYEPVEVNLSCPKEVNLQPLEQYVVMTRK